MKLIANIVLLLICKVISQGIHDDISTIRYKSLGLNDNGRLIALSILSEGGSYLFKSSPKNLIVNGDFSKEGSYADRYVSHGVRATGWGGDTPELGWGPIYNSQWGGVTVAELSDYHNIAMTMDTTLTSGKHYLAFDWAMRVGAPMATSQLSVSINGVHTLSLLGKQNLVFTQALVFEAKNGKNTITLKGQGTNDTLGATFRDLRCFKLIDDGETKGYFESAEFLFNGFNFHQSFERKNLLPPSVGSHLSSFNSRQSFHRFMGHSREYLMTIDVKAENSTRHKLISCLIYFNGIQSILIHPKRHLTERYYVLGYGEVGMNKIEFRLLHAGNKFKDQHVTYSNIEVHAMTNNKVEHTFSLPAQKTEKLSVVGKRLVPMKNIALPMFYAIPANFLQNGDFLKGNPTYSIILTDTIMDWRSKGRMEVGKGKIYNSLWGDNVYVMELDVHKNVVVDVPLHLVQSNYYAAFDWAPRQNQPFNTSLIQLRWNGVLKALFTPTINAILTQSFVFYPLSADTLTFIGAGRSDGLGATITNLRVFEASDPQGYFLSTRFRASSFILQEGYKAKNLLKPRIVQILTKANSTLVSMGFVSQKTTFYGSFDYSIIEQSDSPPANFSLQLNGVRFLQIIPTLYRWQRIFLKVHGQNGHNFIWIKSNLNFSESGLKFRNFEIHQEL